MFRSWSSFLSFRDEKKHEERYFHSREAQEFLDGVLATAADRVEPIAKGQRYWRAQSGSALWPLDDGAGEDVDYCRIAYRPERMKPVPEKAREGRINSRGIPCLYLATNEKTAISEVRPWVGSRVTVAEFEICEDLDVIDCSGCEIDSVVKKASDLDMLYKLTPPEPEEIPQIVWRWIDLAFSEPVDREDSTVDYIQTQIIAELFKANGFGGVIYRSVFNGGKNLALFDIDSACQVGEGKVVQVTELDLNFQQICPFLFAKSRA